MQNAAKETEAGGGRGVRGVSGREHGLDLSPLVVGEVRIENGDSHRLNRASLLMKSFFQPPRFNAYPRLRESLFHVSIFSLAFAAIYEKEGRLLSGRNLNTDQPKKGLERSKL